MAREVESSLTAQSLTGLPIAVAIEVAVPLPEQRLGSGVGADLLAGEPAA
jgi:hypothetical protein